MSTTIKERHRLTIDLAPAKAEDFKVYAIRHKTSMKALVEEWIDRALREDEEKK